MKPAEFDLPEAEILARLESFCYDQVGCRMVQRKMDTSLDKTFVRSLIQRLMPNFIEVSHNIFGNFLCQKVIESCTQAELT
jgi:hypothetical protein